MKWIICYTKPETNAHQHESPLSWIRCLTQRSKEDIIQVLYLGRIPRHTVDINLVFRPVLKGKTTVILQFPNSQLPPGDLNC